MFRLTAFLWLCLICIALPAGYSESPSIWSSFRLAKRRGALGYPDAPEAPPRLPLETAGYLYPVLAWGPNNQVAGLKEALVLGRLLNRTVIVHDILNHYDDKASLNSQYQQPSSMDFGLVFNLDRLAQYQSVVTLAERKANGWSGQLEVVAHFGTKFLAQMKNAHALNVSDDGAKYIDFGDFECVPKQLARIRKALTPYKDVAFIVYENIVHDAGHNVKLRDTGDICHDEYLEMSGQLVKSDKLVNMATSFLEKNLDGDTKRFIAVHIRPYPDKCLFVWQRKTYDPRLAKKMCKNPNLMNVFVNQTRHAMKLFKLHHLFVMSYPELRGRISEMYATAGLKPIFYDEQDLEAAVGYRSISLLGMVEEEIAYEANVFIGTGYSSMSSIIIQERHARGKTKETTWTFTKTTFP